MLHIINILQTSCLLFATSTTRGIEDDAKSNTAIMINLETTMYKIDSLSSKMQSMLSRVDDFHKQIKYGTLLEHLTEFKESMFKAVRVLYGEAHNTRDNTEILLERSQELLKDQQNLYNSIKELQQSIDDLNKKIGNINIGEDISIVKHEITKFNGLHNQLNNIQEINKFGSNISTSVQTDVSALKNQMLILETQITNLNNTLNKQLINNDTFAKLENNFNISSKDNSELNTVVKEINNHITTLEDKFMKSLVGLEESMIRNIEKIANAFNEQKTKLNQELQDYKSTKNTQNTPEILDILKKLENIEVLLKNQQHNTEFSDLSKKVDDIKNILNDTKE